MFDRRSTEEKMILIICGVSAATLLPFAILRLLLGDYLIGLLDSIGLLAAIGLASYVYRVREVEMAGILLSLLAISGMVLHIYIKGISEVYFLYPLMVATYFVVKPAYALALSLLALAILLPVTWVQFDGLAFAKVYLSILGCILFTYAFASQRNEQRDLLLQYSTKDSLTGAGNRRAMDKHLIEAIQRFERSDQPMSLIILDLDEFKNINDTAGHALGDQLLKRVTDIVLARIRITDKLFRYGGDEFVVLADPADLATAARLAEDLRALVEADQAVTGWQLSISLGVAEYVRGEPQESWLSRADEALLVSKRQGRNQVVVSESLANKPIK
jgi:diguanylate cyclase (GGDEF)-like protein